jgi:Fe2+ or Zn2+ uptake regulation protein
MMAFSGSIGFVGLMMLHIVRFVMGNNNARVLPFSVLFGTIFLIWVDIAARVVMAPEDMPVGVVTGLIAGVFFVGLLVRRRIWRVGACGVLCYSITLVLNREATVTKSIPPHATATALSGNDLLVFEVLRAANGPASAYDILERLKPERPRIAPTTVYRALEHLIRAGRVRRIESLNAYLAARDAGDRAVVFAICDDCGRVQERDAVPEVGRITKALAKDGFRPTHPVVEVHGRCGDCDSMGGRA